MSSTERELRVAVVGTGRMGAAMAERLRSVGAKVTVYNRTVGSPGTELEFAL